MISTFLLITSCLALNVIAPTAPGNSDIWTLYPNLQMTYNTLLMHCEVLRPVQYTEINILSLTFQITTTLKQVYRCTPPELVYSTMLYLPGEFFTANTDITTSYPSNYVVN